MFNMSLTYWPKNTASAAAAATARQFKTAASQRRLIEPSQLCAVSAVETVEKPDSFKD